MRACPARFALLACALGCAGCAAGASKDLAIRPPSSAPRPKLALADYVDESNARARQVDALYAQTGVAVKGVGRLPAGLDGFVALERPRNFKLKLKHTAGGVILDVGSNPDEFWFWSKENKDRAVYVGEFNSAGQIDADLPFQPDWIIEALGLREITPEEQQNIQLVSHRSDPGKVVLEHHRTNPDGSTTRKQTVVDAATGLAVRHIYYGPDRKTPIADVSCGDYRPLATGVSSKSLRVPHKITVVLPGNEQTRENPRAEISLRGVELNPEFILQKHELAFDPPKGFPLERLQAASTYAAGDRPREYRSRPTPPAGAELGDPLPIGAEGASLRWDDAMPLGPDLPAGPAEPAGVKSIVRAGLPQLPGEPRRVAGQADSRRGSLGSGFYR